MIGGICAVSCWCILHFCLSRLCPFYPRALCPHTRAPTSPSHTCVLDIVVVTSLCVWSCILLTTSLTHNLGIVSETAPEWCMRSSDLRSASRRPSTHAASEDGVQHLCDTRTSVFAHVVCTTRVSVMQLALSDTHQVARLLVAEVVCLRSRSVCSRTISQIVRHINSQNC